MSVDKKPAKRIRNDFILLLCILLLVLGGFLIYTATKRDGAYAVVLQNGNEIGRYSLTQDGEIPISNGNKVTNVLLIRDGKATMCEADCPDQICVKHRQISKTGETIVCLPNEIVIKIIAPTENGEPDMVS